MSRANACKTNNEREEKLRALPAIASTISIPFTKQPEHDLNGDDVPHVREHFIAHLLCQKLLSCLVTDQKCGNQFPTTAS